MVFIRTPPRENTDCGCKECYEKLIGVEERGSQGLFSWNNRWPLSGFLGGGSA